MSEEDLDALGDIGWELVTVVAPYTDAVGVPQVRYYFKRPL